MDWNIPFPKLRNEKGMKKKNYSQNQKQEGNEKIRSQTLEMGMKKFSTEVPGTGCVAYTRAL